MDLFLQAAAPLKSLGKAMELGGEALKLLSLNDDNEAFLLVDESTLVMFYLDEALRALVLNVPVGPLPEGPDRDGVMFELLCGNYCWNLTEGATLGIDREHGIISLSYLVPLPLEPAERLAGIVEKLADAARHWRNELSLAAEDWKPDAADFNPAFGLRV